MLNKKNYYNGFSMLWWAKINEFIFFNLKCAIGMLLFLLLIKCLKGIKHPNVSLFSNKDLFIFVIKIIYGVCARCFSKCLDLSKKIFYSILLTFSHVENTP